MPPQTPKSKELHCLTGSYPIVDLCENAVYLGIEGVTWDECLRKLSTVDILFDQYLIGSYGMIAVEAAAFDATVFCKLRPDVMAVMAKESGLPSPFIQWIDEEELKTQVYSIAQTPELSKRFGNKAHEYCLKMHDDLNVATRFLKILEKT